MNVPVQIKPVKLEVIKADSQNALEEQVNMRLKRGLLFHGEMQCVVVGGNLYFIQAMVETQIVPMQPPPGMGGGILVPQ